MVLKNEILTKALCKKMQGAFLVKRGKKMAKDDIFKIIYVLLTELYESKKQGRKVDLQDISAERFNINESYLLDILCELLENGYIKGFSVRTTKTGRVVAGLSDIDITLKGIEYLQENSQMKKVYNILKEVKDWMPGL